MNVKTSIGSMCQSYPVDIDHIEHDSIASIDTYPPSLSGLLQHLVILLIILDDSSLDVAEPYSRVFSGD